MSTTTSYLELYEAQPLIDAGNTFNIQTMMNDNWDKLDQEIRKYRKTFSASNWLTDGSASDAYTKYIIIPYSTHGLEPKLGIVQATCRAMKSGNLSTNAWGPMETQVSYDSTTGDIVLRATAAYGGDVILYA